MPKRGDPLKLVINRSLIKTYRGLGENSGGNSRGPNFTEAKRLEDLLADQEELELVIKFIEYD